MTRATRPAADAARRPSPRPRDPEEADESPQETVHSGRPNRKFRFRPGRDRWFWSLVALGVAAVLLLALTGVLYRRDHADDAVRADRDDVVLAARQGVLNLIGLSHTDAEGAYARLVQGTTGAFHDQLTQQAASVTQALTEGQVTSAGQIAEAGVERLSGDEATALVVASANVKNTQAPQGENRQYRLLLTLHREDGRWLVSELEFVA